MKIIIQILFIFIFSGANQIIAQKITDHLVNNYHKVYLDKTGNDSINIYYTGCGGYLIKDGESAIMIDPFLSNITPMLLVRCKKLKSNSDKINSFFTHVFKNKKDLNGIIKAILVAHSHYDHLADVPHIFNENINTDTTKIIGSITTKHLLSKYNISSIAIGNTNYTTDIQCDGEAGKQGFLWIEKNKIRILPILAEHAPHLLGMKFLSKKKLTQPPKKKPLRGRDLPEGENFNYLIDFLDKEGKVKLRVFSNAGSACNANVGFPPKELTNKRKIDILFLCVASFSEVSDYPTAITDSLKPQFILLNHWENFFKPYGSLDPKKPKTVPGTCIKKFIKILDKAKPKPEYVFPMPLTEVVFIY